MTCKDCIHYDVCQSRIAYDENYGDSTSFETRCEDFKDKSKFIELTCNVGNTVVGIESILFYEEQIGKTVFLSREEAEMVLKEWENNARKIN